MHLSFSVAAILVAGLAALPAAARTHHTTERHHAVARHATAHHVKAEHGRTTAHRRAADRRGEAEARAASPAGVMRIPAGGLKVFCAGRSGPLLIRKATQGNGTTVTVICR